MVKLPVQQTGITQLPLFRKPYLAIGYINFLEN